MKRYFYLTLIATLMLIVGASCKKKNGGNGVDVPNEFATMDDRGRVEYLIKKESPDSVARFIIDAALGDIPGARIDTLILAQGVAYEKYENQPDEMAIFSSEMERYAASLDLTRKKKLYAMSGMHDPEGYGYDLGLEYVNNIREKKLSAADVTKEISDLKRACANDPDTYKRFVKGFKLALIKDHVGVPQDVYQRFTMLEDE